MPLDNTRSGDRCIGLVFWWIPAAGGRRLAGAPSVVNSDASNHGCCRRLHSAYFGGWLLFIVRRAATRFSGAPNWLNACILLLCMNDDIQIRLSEDGLGFICSVRRGGALIESAVFGHAGPARPEELFDEYYGGSLATD